jgi:isoquinoline 1-oxidoreductase alpha subunit
MEQKQLRFFAPERREYPTARVGIICYLESFVSCDRRSQTMSTEINVNGQVFSVDAPPEKPLLWVLREDLGFTGTKFGCGISECGACSVHVNGRTVRSCSMELSRVRDRSVTTIEGIAGPVAEAVQAAWRELDVVQCGYCQSGQIMAAMALLATNPSPSDEDIDESMRRNLCRCGTYVRIRAAIHRAAEILGS